MWRCVEGPGCWGHAIVAGENEEVIGGCGDRGPNEADDPSRHSCNAKSLRR